MHCTRAELVCLEVHHPLNQRLISERLLEDVVGHALLGTWRTARPDTFYVDDIWLMNSGGVELNELPLSLHAMNMVAVLGALHWRLVLNPFGFGLGPGGLDLGTSKRVGLMLLGKDVNVFAGGYGSLAGHG
ncbi:hypothetical protein C6380_17625 [Pseudomonas syringae pv. actinidiae]|nr:hypothetical protein BUE60_11360 [Pseudomonas syringae pv. actinidiae]PBK55534.1 hypothetical protein BUE61_07320 [Pseudomonas syringae pv. actinidiae]RJX53988.1 hypothetical protein C6380_17625 [Pseudomonas syringae pv. actinidiae]RJX63536.1 hypothetical protein C6379_00320 [Pseudomonas syringae pv. actinidiae]RJX65181.1 hypothetical protein C6383_00035 [Pseudomonas syringae pv. actinidiae]